VRILFEDDHLLAVDKPSGLNTHRPDRFAIDGLHEWLSQRKPAWASLSVLHRLDKETSGVVIHGKSRAANQSLSHQFEKHQVVKEYWLLSTSPLRGGEQRIRDDDGETRFESADKVGPWHRIVAWPVTGKTHQVRRHAAKLGIPVAGDSAYGGVPAPRLMLHARSISIRHPVSGELLRVESPLPSSFGSTDPLTVAVEFRSSLFFDEPTNAYRLLNGQADDVHGVVVDKFGDHLLVQWQAAPVAGVIDRLRALCPVNAIWEQTTARTGREPPALAWPASIDPAHVDVMENGLSFRVRPGEGLTPGIFFDQRDNRRQILGMELSGMTALNCFAHTCAFSVAAARAGATVTSLDLSRRYLDWGRENFTLNDMNPDQHDFVYGDVFDWLKRFGKRQRTWDIVLLDPPTFSTSKKGRTFRAARDYGELVARALPLVAPGGWLFCSTNLRTMAPDAFLQVIEQEAHNAGRVIESVQFRTQPPDVRVAPGEHPYLKTVWARLQ
jgi:23S rRNA (cytosine1962-C5)-methyltransferase